MRNQLISLFLFVLLPLAARAEEARVLSMSGNVEVRQTREGQWIAASDKIEIAEGGGIRTGADGGAVLLMPNKTKVWLKDNSTLEIEQRQTLSSRLALVFGRIKIRVPHLMRREKFEVRTPAAVCAVRGTEFTMDTTEDGKMNLQVLFGEVKLKFIVPPEKGKMEFNIPQGQGLSLEEKGKSAKPVLLTAANERAALENWNPGLKPEERQKDLQQKDNDRAQIKEFAKVTNNAESAVKSFLNVVKESDLEAGRTLSDVHGNLVRVDQRMIRPDGNTIQFFNIVKRPVYANYTYTNAMAAAHGFSYNAGAAVTDRLDLMQMNMRFDAALPQRIEEWPSFFKDSNIHPDYATFIMANRTDDSSIFFIAQPYNYVTERDELINNETVLGRKAGDDKDVIITGILTNDGVTGISAMEGLARISRLEVTGNDNGTLKYTGAVTPDVVATVQWAQNMGVSEYSYSSEDAGSDDLWSYNANLYSIGALGTVDSKIWFATENYVMNNSGAIQTKDSITSSGTDPFTLLKNIAGESIYSVKKYIGVGNSYANINNGASGDMFSTKNIDIVYIPDLMVAAVQRLLPAITELGN